MKTTKNTVGCEARVFSRTAGATYVCEVYDASGTYRRDLMGVDGGMDRPHRRLAMQEAHELSTRWGIPVREL